MNDGRIPPRYQEELLGSVNTLVDSIACAAPEEDEDKVEEGDEEKENHGKDEGDGGEGKNGKEKDGKG